MYNAQSRAQGFCSLIYVVIKGNGNEKQTIGHEMLQFRHLVCPVNSAPSNWSAGENLSA